MKEQLKEKEKKKLRDDPSRVVILGGGRGGAAMLETLLEEDLVEVVGIVDCVVSAPGIKLAVEKGIPTYTDVEVAVVASAPCVVFNLTGNEMVEEVVGNILGVGGVIGGLEAKLMWRMVTNLKEAKNILEFQATHDVLTNLVNRRFMLKHMEQELDRCRRYGVDCSLIMVDLDHFKHVNDHYGHSAGDEVLKAVTTRIRNHLRSTDVLSRWGGEEFLIMLPHTGKKEGEMVAKKCLKVVADQEIKLGLDISISVSFSAGLASFQEVEKSLSMRLLVEEMLAIADKRMYRAKELGRSRVVCDR